MTGLAIIIAAVAIPLLGIAAFVRWLRYSNDKAFAELTDEQRFIYEDIIQQIENPQPPVGVAATEGDIVDCPHCGTELFRFRRTVQWMDERDLVRDLESIDDRLPQPNYADHVPACPECGSDGWMAPGWLTRVREPSY